ncbi:MAG: signal peptidase I [Clostridia bacterium]|nr:signal peptidase I [Clostridia bacterium]
MTRDKKILYAISLSTLAALLLTLFVPQSSSRIIAAILLLLSAVLSTIFIKKRSILAIEKRQVLLIMATIAVMSIVLYFLTALYFGFRNSGYRMSWQLIWVYIIPITAIIISIEIVRSILLAQNNKKVTVIAYFIGVTTDILVISNLVNINTFNKFMDVLGLAFLPAIITNLFYHYISKRYGRYPNIVYRLIISLYPYIIIYRSAMSDSLLAISRIIIPMLMYWFISALYEKKKRYALKRHGKLGYIFVGVFAVVMISIVMLISCQFRYGALVIGSESMTGELNKGDISIYEQYDGHIIEKGDVIVFEKDGTRVVHRVVDIKRINNVNRYYTKGDVNEHFDTGYITDGNIIGVTKMKVAYLGYPTIWLRNLVSKF